MALGLIDCIAGGLIIVCSVAMLFWVAATQARVAGAVVGTLVVGGFGVLIYMLGSALQKLSNTARVLSILTVSLGLLFDLLSALLQSPASGPAAASQTHGAVNSILTLVGLGMNLWRLCVLASGRAAFICSKGYHANVPPGGTEASAFASPLFWPFMGLYAVTFFWGLLQNL